MPIKTVESASIDRGQTVGPRNRGWPGDKGARGTENLRRFGASVRLAKSTERCAVD